MLRAADFVAHEQHGRARGQQLDRAEVLALTIAKRLDRGVVGRSLYAAVSALIVVRPVSIAFAVGLVVLAVVRDEIVQREAVVTGDEVDAVFGFPILVTVEIGAAQEP